MLKVMEKVPNFTLEGIDLSGELREISLSEFLGKNVVLYFYPKDNTPGCTKEACGFRDLMPSRDDTIVIGVSKDSIKSHESFRNKYDLNFVMLSDKDREVATLFGSAQLEKSSVNRQTFLIDKEGVLVKEWRTVKVVDHMKKVFDYIEGM